MFYEGFGGESIACTLRFWIAFHDREAEFLVARGDAVKKIKRAFDEDAVREPQKVGAGNVDAGAVDLTPAAATPDHARHPR